MRSFVDKVIIVTGGTSGIGLGLAKRFAQKGAGVVISARNAEAAKARAEEIGSLAVAGDVAVEADVQRLVDTTLAGFGRIDLFASNAGIAFDAGLDAPSEKWQEVFRVNVLAHVHAAKYALPSMLERCRLHTECQGDSVLQRFPRRLRAPRAERRLTAQRTRR